MHFGLDKSNQVNSHAGQMARNELNLYALWSAILDFFLWRCRLSRLCSGFLLQLSWILPPELFLLAAQSIAVPYHDTSEAQQSILLHALGSQDSNPEASPRRSPIIKGGVREAKRFPHVKRPLRLQTADFRCSKASKLPSPPRMAASVPIAKEPEPPCYLRQMPALAPVLDPLLDDNAPLHPPSQISFWPWSRAGPNGSVGRVRGDYGRDGKSGT